MRPTPQVSVITLKTRAPRGRSHSWLKARTFSGSSPAERARPMKNIMGREAASDPRQARPHKVVKAESRTLRTKALPPSATEAIPLPQSIPPARTDRCLIENLRVGPVSYTHLRAHETR